MVDEFRKSEAIIVTLANRYLSKFYNSSLYDLDDLISEGWLVYLDCKKKENEGIIEHKFTTYLYSAVNNRYKSLYRNEHVYKKRKHEKACIDGFDFDSKNLSPENAVMAVQALVALSEISYDFATMVIEGVPKDLLFIARRHMRAKRISNNNKNINCSMLFTKHMLENFFKVDIETLKVLVSKYL